MMVSGQGATARPDQAGNQALSQTKTGPLSLPRASSVKLSMRVRQSGLEIFPSKAQKDSGLKANQAKHGPEVKHNGVELILRHMHCPPGDWFPEYASRC
jgi:hypothetical protein